VHWIKNDSIAPQLAITFGAKQTATSCIGSDVIPFVRNLSTAKVGKVAFFFFF
jgi:hypothetical protein